MTQDQQQLLRDARAKTQKLVTDLVAQQQDLDRFASGRQIAIAPEKLAPGQQAIARAIDSARRTIEGIDQALASTASTKDSH
jgi:hypothetical protein